MDLAGRIEAIEADITTLAIDAIVNAANSELMPGGGVDGSIRKRAGQELNDELRGIGFCAEGDALITPGYKLPAAYVIHTVAPIWAGGEERAAQEQLLARCYANALKLADENNVHTHCVSRDRHRRLSLAARCRGADRVRCGGRASQAIRDAEHGHVLLFRARRPGALCRYDRGLRE